MAYKMVQCLSKEENGKTSNMIQYNYTKGTEVSFPLYGRN